jgi:hypothetical protein
MRKVFLGDQHAADGMDGDSVTGEAVSARLRLTRDRAVSRFIWRGSTTMSIGFWTE